MEGENTAHSSVDVGEQVFSEELEQSHARHEPEEASTPRRESIGEPLIVSAIPNLYSSVYYQPDNSVRTEIYQQDELQDGTVITRVTGIKRDCLHPGVDLFTVEPCRDRDEENEQELLSLKEVIISQTNLMLDRFQIYLENLESQIECKREFLDSERQDSTLGIEKLEEKYVEECTRIKYKEMKSEMKLIAKELTRQRTFLRDLREIEREAWMKELHALQKLRQKEHRLFGEACRKGEYRESNRWSIRKLAEEGKTLGASGSGTSPLLEGSDCVESYEIPVEVSRISSGSRTSMSTERKSSNNEPESRAARSSSSARTQGPLSRIRLDTDSFPRKPLTRRGEPRCEI